MRRSRSSVPPPSARRSRVPRTTFARQAADLCPVKRRLHLHFTGRPAGGERASQVDSLSVDGGACGRAKFVKRLRGEAAYRHDHTRRNSMHNFQLHVRATPSGASVDFELAVANVSAQAVVADVAPPPGLAVVGDRNYWSPTTAAVAEDRGVKLVALFHTKLKDPDSNRANHISRLRWIIETAFGQLAGRFHVKRRGYGPMAPVAPRHPHTAAVRLSVRSGRKPLGFDGPPNF